MRGGSPDYSVLTREVIAAAVNGVFVGSIPAHGAKLRINNLGATQHEASHLHGFVGHMNPNVRVRIV